MLVWPGNSAQYINFLRGFSLDSWSVFRGVDDELLENEKCVEGSAFSDGLCCVCSGLDLVSLDVDGVGVGRAGAAGRECGGCARSGREVGFVVGSLAGARTEDGSDRSITGERCGGCEGTVFCRFAGLDPSGISTGRGGGRSEGDLNRSIGVRLIPRRSFKDRDDCEDGCDDRVGKFLACDCDGCDGCDGEV